MTRFVSSFALLVPSYEAGIQFFVEKLGFILVEDTPLTPSKRWVRVAPDKAAQTTILLAQAASDDQRLAIGNQSGGRVFLFLETDDFERDYAAFRNKGVSFVRDPVDEPYGRVAVFKDAFGNQWDLIQSSGRVPASVPGPDP